MTNIAATATASIAKPNTLAISVSRFCLRSLRLYAEFILFPLLWPSLACVWFMLFKLDWLLDLD